VGSADPGPRVEMCRGRRRVASRWCVVSMTPAATPAVPGSPVVLLAEDDRDTRELVALTLSMTGFSVRAARNGVEALEMADRYRPSVALLDVRMPRLDGIEVCRRLRSRAEFVELPIILVSAMSGEVDAARGLSAGATEYLVKPFSPRELAAHVGEVLQRHRPHLGDAARTRAKVS
jgi:two-component system, OmpR family, phosphate regulon response regulator PhoB